MELKPLCRLYLCPDDGECLAVEIAVILCFLVHCRILSHETLKAKRRYFILFAFIFSAIVTPPDVLTQLLLAVPLTLLYEFAIIYSIIRSKKCIKKIN